MKLVPLKCKHQFYAITKKIEKKAERKSGRGRDERAQEEKEAKERKEREREKKMAPDSEEERKEGAVKREG